MLDKINTYLAKIKTTVQRLSTKQWLAIALGLTIVICVTAFLTPKQVNFSYSERSCASQFSLAPRQQKVTSDEFDIIFENITKLGGAALFSTKACFEPRVAPKQGSHRVSATVLNRFIGNKNFVVTVPAAPSVETGGILGSAISVTKPLKVQISSVDIVHDYHLEVADRSSYCSKFSIENGTHNTSGVVDDKAVLNCDVKALELKSGEKYNIKFKRSFNGSAEDIAEGKVETLDPLVITDASIVDGVVIYDKPTEFMFVFDRQVAEADISLKVMGGDPESAQAPEADSTSETSPKPNEIPTKISINGQEVRLGLSEPLARESRYRLTINEVIGTNGSSLEDHRVVNFTTSGGPKVASVSVGDRGIARNAAIIVTFDQPIDPEADIASFARSEGVVASVGRHSETQIVFSIQGGDCAAFNLIIDKGLKGALNGEEAKAGWSFNGRTVCGYSWTIGNSVQGRPIVAYSFGSGQTVLFTGGMHGSEPSGYSTMLAWAQHLQLYGDSIPAGKRVVIVPNTNPDGIAAGSRNNSRNVNIGRNFPSSNWRADIDTTNGLLPSGGGTSPGSEPEASALINLTRQLQPRLQVSFHAQGRLVGANKVADSVAVGTTYANIVGYRTMFYDAEAVMGYTMTGEYEDWMGEELGVPAILIELPSTSGNYLNSQLAALLRMVGV